MASRRFPRWGLPYSPGQPSQVQLNDKRALPWVCPAAGSGQAHGLGQAGNILQVGCRAVATARQLTFENFPNFALAVALMWGI